MVRIYPITNMVEIELVGVNSSGRISLGPASIEDYHGHLCKRALTVTVDHCYRVARIQVARHLNQL